jgi:hypothetical protein
MGLFGKPSTKLTPDGWLLPKNAKPMPNEGPGTYSYNVVGESHCNASLRRIIEDEGLDPNVGGEIYTQAFLLCEPQNKFDKNAVAVVVALKRVGYIPREDAKDLASQLTRMASRGEVLLVKARIGWQDPAVIGVQLDLAAK